MKKLILIVVLTSIIFISQFSLVNGQTFKDLMDSTEFYQGKQDFKQALNWAEKAHAQSLKEFPRLDTNYYYSLNKLGDIYYVLGNLDKALYYYDSSYKIIKEIYKGDHRDVATTLTQIANIHHNNGNLKDAEMLLKEALEMYKRFFGKDDLNIANCTNNLAAVYIDEGRIQEAESLYIESIAMKKRLYPDGHPDLATSIANFSSLYRNTGRMKEAESLNKEALEMNRRLFKTDHPSIARCLNSLASLYSAMGKYEESETLNKEALEMFRKIFGDDNLETAFANYYLAILYKIQGRYLEAEPILKEILKITRQFYSQDNSNIVAILTNLGEIYQLLGRNEEAESIFNEGLAMCRRLFTGDYPEIAICLNNLGGVYQAEKRYNEAESLLKESLEMNKRLYKGDFTNLAANMNSLAWLYQVEGKLSEAEPLYVESMNMYKRIFKGDHPDVWASTYNLAFFYQTQGRLEESEKLSLEALEMSKRMFKEENVRIALSLMDLSSLYILRNNFTEAEKSIKEAMETLKAVYFKNSSRLSEKEKEQYWKTMNNFFETFISFSLKRMKDNPDIIGAAFDNILFSKAILFNSSNKIKKRIFSSGDSLLISMYKEYIGMKDMLLKFYSMTSSQLKSQGINLDSIENNVNNIEKEISLKSEIYKQSYEKKKVTWKTIQAVLKPDEAAVEAVRFRYVEKNRPTDTIYYVFLIVTDQTEEHPDLILLENGIQLENEFYNEYRNLIKIHEIDSLSYGRFWGKLNDRLKDYKKIYFSPDGIYNKLNPSTLMMPDGKFLLDIQDIQQVNSSKDLLLGYYQTKQESNLLNSAILIGNPNFGLEEDKVKETARKIRGEKQDEKSYEQLEYVRGLSLTRLPGTEKEIKDIEKFLKTKSWVINSYLGDMAVKTAIKNANSPRILHIATHGLFLEDVKRKGKELFGFEEQKMVENPLLRSGLFFTGADNYISKENPGFIEEDNGLLTAYEAMNLNLDKTELVVLSACETGLGEIQNGEGVFGLRRAFQQAGAKTVLMSLWKVSDDATQELMSNFYRNWVSGMTKREAFHLAQIKIKEKYIYPYYWGAFIMVGE
jgi:CHAT domain-containing protein